MAQRLKGRRWDGLDYDESVILTMIVNNLNDSSFFVQNASLVMVRYGCAKALTSAAPIMHAAPEQAGRPAFALARPYARLQRRLKKCRKVEDFECSVGPCVVRHRMRPEDVCYGRNSNAPRGTAAWRAAASGHGM